MNTVQTRVVKQIWMDYFNRTLWKQGLITEREYNLLRRKIQHQNQSEGSLQNQQKRQA